MSLGAVQILQKSLADAQKGLSNTDNEIKRLTGREPQARFDRKRNTGGQMRAWSGEYVPPAKRRPSNNGDRPRMSDRLGERKRSGGPPFPPPPPHSDEEEDEKETNIKSSVVAAPVPPRPMADPTEDKASKKRNQRMFGFLMGTLQKFQKDSNEKTEQEKRRAEIEEKLELAAAKEKQDLTKQRKELFEQRRNQQQRIGLLADQVEMAEIYEEWNVHDRHLIGFIKTKCKPPIFYLPSQHNETTEKLVKETQNGIEELMSKRKTELEKIASDQSEVVVMETVEQSVTTEDITGKSRNKATLGRDESSNEESDQD